MESLRPDLHLWMLCLVLGLGQNALTQKSIWSSPADLQQTKCELKATLVIKELLSPTISERSTMLLLVMSAKSCSLWMFTIPVWIKKFDLKENFKLLLMQKLVNTCYLTTENIYSFKNSYIFKNMRNLKEKTLGNPWIFSTSRINYMQRDNVYLIN